MSDKLAKELQQYLYNAAESNGERGWPANAGWYDFLAGDRPETQDPLEMTIEAVWYLADCEGGKWVKPKLCFQAAISYLKVKLKFLPQESQLREIAALVQSPPNKDKLETWFHNSYSR